MGAGLRPRAKVVDKPPDPNVRAPVLDPTASLSFMVIKLGLHFSIVSNPNTPLLLDLMCDTNLTRLVVFCFDFMSSPVVASL